MFMVPVPLPIERRGMAPLAGGDEGGDNLPQVFTGEVGNLEVGLDPPLSRDVLLEGGVDALQHAGDAELRVARDRVVSERADRVFPHLRPYLFQAQNDVQQAAPLQAQGARASTP